MRTVYNNRDLLKTRICITRLKAPFGDWICAKNFGVARAIDGWITEHTSSGWSEHLTTLTDDVTQALREGRCKGLKNAGSPLAANESRIRREGFENASRRKQDIPRHKLLTPATQQHMVTSSCVPRFPLSAHASAAPNPADLHIAISPPPPHLRQPARFWRRCVRYVDPALRNLCSQPCCFPSSNHIASRYVRSGVLRGTLVVTPVQIALSPDAQHMIWYLFNAAPQ
ncbi:hypothetical protein M3J09_009899 [Ascochyta lentis]